MAEDRTTKIGIWIFVLLALVLLIFFIRILYFLPIPSPASSPITEVTGHLPSLNR